MSKRNRLFDLASQAIDKAAAAAATPNAKGGADWTSLFRTSAGAPQAEQRPSPAPAQPAEVGRDVPRRPVGLTPPPPGADSSDRAAVARYEYLLRTADPSQIEQVHREAFAGLTATQREQLAARMRTELPAYEHPRSSNAADLARTATRAEASRPGMLSGLLARTGGRGGRGALAGAGIGAAGGVLAAVAGGAIVSSVAAPLLANAANLGVDFDALAGAVDLDGLAGGVGDLTAGAGDLVSGVSDQVAGFGEQLGSFEIPGLGDLFGR